MPPGVHINPLDDVIIVKCKGGVTLRLHHSLLRSNSQLFVVKLQSKRQIAPGIHTVRVDLPRRCLHRYALWLYGSPDFSTFDPSLAAPGVFLELADLHVHAAKLQDEAFENELMDAMVSHLTERFDEMLLDDFLAEFLRSYPSGSAGRRFIADWLVWLMVASDVKPESLLQKIQDASFYCYVVKALLKKKEKEWESGSMPPYVVSKCFYHTHVHTSKAGCGAGDKHEAKIEKITV